MKINYFIRFFKLLFTESYPHIIHLPKHILRTLYDNLIYRFKRDINRRIRHSIALPLRYTLMTETAKPGISRISDSLEAFITIEGNTIKTILKKTRYDSSTSERSGLQREIIKRIDDANYIIFLLYCLTLMGAVRKNKEYKQVECLNAIYRINPLYREFNLENFVF